MAKFAIGQKVSAANTHNGNAVESGTLEAISGYLVQIRREDGTLFTTYYSYMTA